MMTRSDAAGPSRIDIDCTLVMTPMGRLPQRQEQPEERLRQEPMRMLLTTHLGIPVLPPAGDAARTLHTNLAFDADGRTWSSLLDPVTRLADARDITRRFGDRW
jgi:hypothetical protein